MLPGREWQREMGARERADIRGRKRRRRRSTQCGPDTAEQIIKSGPTPDEIRQRAFEIHIENGGIYGCDFDDWLQAEREFQEKYRIEKESKKK
jgi:hypothetical protein